MKRTKIWMAALALMLVTAQPARAAEVSAVVDGALLTEGSSILKENATYVSLRAFCEQAAQMEVRWSDGCAVAQKAGLTVTATPGQTYIEANGRYFYTGEHTPVLLTQGKTMVPLRALTRVFQGTVEWDAGQRTARASLGAVAASGAEYYDGEAVYWLSRIISAESQGEPLLGKIAVGNVILNRVDSSQFPNTIKEVIFDRKNGVQFTPVSVGSIYWEPTQESVIAAKLCLDGAVVTGESLYFRNSALAQSVWVVENCKFIRSIGCHQFYQ